MMTALNILEDHISGINGLHSFVLNIANLVLGYIRINPKFITQIKFQQNN